MHATRLYLDNMPDDHLFLKLDFSNAFNSLRRNRMLESVRQRAPEMYRFVFFAYEEPSYLFCGDAVLPSQEGVTARGPSGASFFCLTIYPLIEQLTSEFRLFYLDDGIMGGCLSDTLHDLQNLEVLASDLGLRLNQDKSELFYSDPATREEILSTVPGLHVLIHDEVAVLESPVGGIKSLSGAILEKVERLHLMGDRLHLMHAHDTLLLLTHSFSMPKILHMLRTAPCFLSPAVETYDSLLRECWEISPMSVLKRMEHGLKLPYLWELEVLAFAERHSLHLPPSWLLLLAALSSSTKSSLLRCKVSLTPREMLLSLPDSTAMTKSLHQVQPPITRRLGTLL